MHPRLRQINKLIVLISLLLYTASLMLPAFSFDKHGEVATVPGYIVVFSGAMAFAGGAMAEWLIWLANPLFLLGIIMFSNQRPKSLRFAVAAALLAWSFLLMKEVVVSEGGVWGIIYKRHAGYWLWAGGLSFFALGNMYYYRKHQQLFKQE
jgi:hypothetical protein